MPSKKLLKKCTFFDQHFEEEKADVIFKYLTKDVCTKQEIIQKMRFDKPNKNIYENILKHKADGDDIKKVHTVNSELQTLSLNPESLLGVPSRARVANPFVTPHLESCSVCLPSRGHLLFLGREGGGCKVAMCRFWCALARALQGKGMPHREISRHVAHRARCGMCQIRLD